MATIQPYAYILMNVYLNTLNRMKHNVLVRNGGGAPFRTVCENVSVHQLKVCGFQRSQTFGGVRGRAPAKKIPSMRNKRKKS